MFVHVYYTSIMSSKYNPTHWIERNQYRNKFTRDPTKVLYYQ